MRIDKTTYRSFGTYIKYEPVAGLEIRRAIQDGIEIFEHEKVPVEIHINDVVITVTKNSKIEKLIGEYFTKIDRKNKQLQRETVNYRGK